MAYTRHGHHIPNTYTDAKERQVARCGGLRMCSECIRDASPYSWRQKGPSNMPTYQTKSEQVQAWQLTPEDADSITLMVGGKLVEEIDPEDADKKFVGLNIPTLEGVIRASEGDYIIKGPNGQYFVLKPNEFEYKYESV